MLIDHKDLILLLAAAIAKQKQVGNPYGQLHALLEEITNHTEQFEARDAHMKQILETGKDEPLKGGDHA